MRISTKGRYALILMMDLAVYNTGEPIRLKEIARRQQISGKYLEQIISILNKAGYVYSIRGPQGGYMLKKEPKSYTVGMILRLMEGNLSTIDEVELNSTEYECATTRVWEKLDKAVNQVVDGITLEELAQWQVAKADQYVI